MTERAAPGRRRWRRAPVQVDLPLPDPRRGERGRPGLRSRRARRAAVVARPHRSDCAGRGYRAVAALGGGCARTGAPRARHRRPRCNRNCDRPRCDPRAPSAGSASRRTCAAGRPRPMRRSACPSHPSCSSSTCRSATRSSARSRSRSTRSTTGGCWSCNDSSPIRIATCASGSTRRRLALASTVSVCRAIRGAESASTSGWVRLVVE